MSAFRRQEEKWEEQVGALVASRFYADEVEATRFAAKHVLPAWRAAMEVEKKCAEELLGKRGMKGTAVLIVHLFARAVLGVGGSNDPAPRIVTWRPSGQRGAGGAPVTYRVIATRDIARIVRRSPSAVRRTLRAFKEIANTPDGAAICNVLSLPTGVALDGLLSPATRHPFMYGVHEYAEARAYAQECKRRSRKFTSRQTRWCDTAMP